MFAALTGLSSHPLANREPIPRLESSPSTVSCFFSVVWGIRPSSRFHRVASHGPQKTHLPVVASPSDEARPEYGLE